MPCIRFVSFPEVMSVSPILVISQWLLMPSTWGNNQLNICALIRRRLEIILTDVHSMLAAPLPVLTMAILNAFHITPFYIECLIEAKVFCCHCACPEEIKINFELVMLILKILADDKLLY